ncbi:FAD-dependent oxidoreductase [Candidatus Hodarchaeum mangrovi]
MKVLLIGGNPAALSAASAIRREHADWEICVYEKDKFVSYGACGIPYYVSDKVKSLDNLITLTKDDLEKKRKIPVFINHEVISVDFQKKKCAIYDKDSDKSFYSKYDYLVIATGAIAKLVKGLDIDHPRVFKVHTLYDAKRLKNFLKSHQIKSVVIIGGGYIGLEMLEAYLAYSIEGSNITVISPQLVFNSESQDYIINVAEKYRINLMLNQRVKSLDRISEEKIKVNFQDGKSMNTDLVQISIGVVPNTDIFKNSQLKLLPNGAIITDEFMRTNIPNVYAAGDCVASYHNILEKPVFIPLAPTANKQGRIAGSHIAGTPDLDPFSGVYGTAIFKVLDLYCGRTGITLEEAKELGYQADYVLIENNEIAHYYPGATKMSVLLVFCTKTHRLLGAEITAPSPMGAKKIDTLATALACKMTIRDLQKLDLAYAPPFSSVWDPILIAANIARKKCT